MVSLPSPDAQHKPKLSPHDLARRGLDVENPVSAPREPLGSEPCDLLQVRAKELDSRTDLFSFGVVLYEMATGAFRFAESSGLIFDAILNRPPVAPVRLNPTCPRTCSASLIR